MKSCVTIDLGTIAYGEAAALQQRLVAARKVNAIPDLLLFCEHPHVITLGRNGTRENLLASEDLLRLKGVDFHHTNRGGDITYHGPGQIVGYPILDLNGIRRDVVWYVRQLEECMIRATSTFAIQAFRVPGRTGVWVYGERDERNGNSSIPEKLENCWDDRPPIPERHQNRRDDHPPIPAKLASIGVHISRWVTSHGFAYNVSTDLSFFDLITPCGIADCRVTSLEALLGGSVSRADVTVRLKAAFAETFALELLPAPAESHAWLALGSNSVGLPVR
jgi:lipoyl(octanoyl) transferase